MKRSFLKVLILLFFGLGIIQLQAQDRTVTFDVKGTGVSKPIIWGLDLAWRSEANVRRGIAFMGANRVDLIRSSFVPTDPIVNGELQGDALDWTNERLNIINTWLGSNTQVMLNLDAPTIDASFVGNAANFAELIDVTTRYHQDIGRTVVTVAPLNEPDYATQNGSISDFYNICGQLRNNSRFNNIRICGGNTLNCDEALYWYNYLRDRLDEGNTHQLAGSFDSYANFFQEVRANGHHATNDELHNVMEAMVGVEYGMQIGIWWGTAEYARGEFVKASDGVRLGYAEHRTNWTAASVYRAPDDKVQAFLGGSERQAATTTYKFVSENMDVFFDGHGPQREFTITYPGGSVGSYQNGQTNAERVINITWGEDIQPVIDGIYVLVNRNSGLVMEVEGGSTTAGANIQQGNNTGATYQQWNVSPVDSRVGGDFSYFSITAVHNGMAPDIYNWSLDNGGNVVVWDNNISANQQYYLEYAEDGWFYIRSRHSAKCLDVSGASTAAGANIQQWDKNGGANQQWRFLPVGAPVEFTAPNVPSNLAGTSNTSSIHLTWTASTSSDVADYTIFRAEQGGEYNTLARYVTSTSYDDYNVTSDVQYYYKVKAVDNSLNRSGYSNEAGPLEIGAGSCDPSTITPYYQVNGGTWTIGTSITINSGDVIRFGPQPVSGGSWSWSGCGTSGSSREQTVTLTSSCSATAIYTNSCGAQSSVTYNVTVSGSDNIISGHVYTVQSRNSGKVMDVLNVSTANGSQIIQYDDYGTDNQRWAFEQDGEGYWILEPLHASGKVLDVPNCNFTNGNQLNIWDAFGNDCQRFQFEDLGDGYYRIHAYDNSKCVDVNGASLDNLAEIILWDCHTGYNQQWNLIDHGLRSAMLSEGGSNVDISAFPNPVETELLISVNNFKGKVFVEIYSSDGRLEKQVTDYIDASGRIIIPHWGYKGLGLVKVMAGQDINIIKMEF